MAELTMDELQKQLEDIKKAQAGSDRRVRELTDENQELKKQLDEKQAGKQNHEAMLERKQRVWEMASEKGMDPKTAMTLIFGEDDEEKLDLLETTEQDIRLEERDAFAKKYGRTVQSVDLNKISSPTYQDFMSMSDEQIKRLPANSVNRAIDNELSAKRGTVRSKLEAII